MSAGPASIIGTVVSVLLMFSCNFGKVEGTITAGMSPSTAQLVTWDGRHNTIFEVGDYILVESRATGARLHARFCFMQSRVSGPFTCAMAVQCSSTSGHVELYSEQNAIRSFGKGRDQPRTKAIADGRFGGYEVSCGNGHLTVHLIRQRAHRHYYFDFKVALHTPLVQDAIGLLGSPDKDASNDFLVRNGAPIRTNSTALDLHHALAFQRSWLVRADESMFSQGTRLRPRGSRAPDVQPPISDRRAMLTVSSEPSSELVARRSAGEAACGRAGVPASAMEGCVVEWLATASDEHDRNIAHFCRRLGC